MIVCIIISMLGQPLYKLRDWIPVENLDLKWLCSNPHPHTQFLLEEWWDEIRTNHNCLEALLANPSAAQMIEAHWVEIMTAIGTVKRICKGGYDCSCWTNLCSNPNTLHLIEKAWKFAVNNLNWEGLCKNPNIASFLEKNWRCVFIRKSFRWDILARNPSPGAVELFASMYRPGKDDAGLFCFNPSAISLLEEHWDDIEENNWINWYGLCGNPNAISLLEKHLHKVQHTLDAKTWKALCGNPNAMHLVEKYWHVVRDNLDSLNRLENFNGWDYLCSNPSAVFFLKKHWDEILPNISWNALCCNPSTDAAALVEKHWNLISNHPSFYWSIVLNLCYNHNRPLPLPISLIEKHWDEIVNSEAKNLAREIFKSPDIFVLDYAAMRSQARPFAEELAAKVFHPRRVAAWEAAGIDVAEDL